jgi:hypothetical protein
MLLIAVVEPAREEYELNKVSSGFRSLRLMASRSTATDHDQTDGTQQAENQRSLRIAGQSQHSDAGRPKLALGGPI